MVVFLPRRDVCSSKSLDAAKSQQLIERLPDWETEARTSGHESPRFAPNLLNLLADMGLRGGDDPRIEALLDAMLRHQDESGRFASFCQGGRGRPPAWGAMLCDHHAVTEVLVPVPPRP